MVRRLSVQRWFARWLTPTRKVALLFGVLGVLIGAAGYANQYCDSDLCDSLPRLGMGWEHLIKDFYANVAASLVTITIAVFTIDWLNERQAEHQLKAQLIREMGHPTDNGIALKAVEELRVRGWLEDGSLRAARLDYANLKVPAELEEVGLTKDVDLSYADLQDAYLEHARLHNALLFHANLKGAHLEDAKLHGAQLGGADLREADLNNAELIDASLENADLRGSVLYDANLRGANLCGAQLEGATSLIEAQLVAVFRLHGAVMPDCRRYDGRYKRPWDILSASQTGSQFDPNDSKAMADYYGVPLEVYLAGQEWACENLPRLRREAGLDQEADPLEQPQNSPALKPQEPAEIEGIRQPEVAPSNGTPITPTTDWSGYALRRLRNEFWPFGRQEQ